MLCNSKYGIPVLVSVPCSGPGVSQCEHTRSLSTTLVVWQFRSVGSLEQHSVSTAKKRKHFTTSLFLSVVGEFSKIAVEFIKKGTNPKMYQAASRKFTSKIPS